MRRKGIIIVELLNKNRASSFINRKTVAIFAFKINHPIQTNMLRNTEPFRRRATQIRNQRTDAFCCRAEDMSAYEYRKVEDTSRRNGNQLGAASYDWDLSYWQATLANLRRDLLGLSRRPTASWFPWGPNPWETILLPTMTPCPCGTSSPLQDSRVSYWLLCVTTVDRVLLAFHQIAPLSR